MFYHARVKFFEINIFGIKSATFQFTLIFRFDGTDGLLITDGVNWKPVAETRYHHKKSRLATYKVGFQLTPTQFSSEKSGFFFK